MKRWICFVLMLGLLAGAPLSSFAEETEKKTSEEAGKTEFYFINNKLYLKVSDAMSLLGYKKEKGDSYLRMDKRVVFDPKALTVSFEGLAKKMEGDLQQFGTEMIISANAVEELFGKSLTTKGNFAKFNLINNPEKKPGDWTQHRIVAHALGSADGMVKTNTLDALQESYLKGHRLFEVDLLMTADGKLVATPGFYEYQSFKYGKPIPEDKLNILPTKEEFMSFSPNGVLKPLDFESIVRMMSANKDMFLITDTKATDFVQAQKQFKELVETAKSIDASVLERIIPQIYNEQMYDAVRNQHPFKSLIYTLYQTTSTNAEVLQFASAKGIKVVTMSPERLNPVDIAMYNSYGVKVYTHTINSLEEIKGYKDMGVYGFYSDFVTPEHFETLQ